MNSLSPTIGTQSDAELRVGSQLSGISCPKLTTIQDLLLALENDIDIRMLRTTAGHISRMLGVTLEQLRIEALLTIGPRFKTYLTDCRYRRNAVRSYQNYARKLLNKAQNLGWKPSNAEFAQAWSAVRAAVTAHGESGAIVNYAVAHAINPSNFSKTHLDNWKDEMAGLHRACEYIDKLCSRFRRAMADAGFSQDLGAVRPWKVQYGIPLEQFPQPLRSEVESLLRWKQARYAEGRRKASKHRKISAEALQAFISQLYGFWAGVRGHKEVNSVL